MLEQSKKIKKSHKKHKKEESSDEEQARPVLNKKFEVKKEAEI
jgi:hypothetical protein